MNKKGKISFALTAGTILAVALLVFVLFGGLSLFTWILGANLWKIIGIFLLVAVGLSYLIGRPIPFSVGKWLLIIGVALVLLPFFSDFFKEQTLAMVLP